MRSRAWAAAVAAATLVTAGLGGCAADDAEGGASPDSTSAATSPEASSESPGSGTEGSEEDAETEAATGRRVETEVLSYRLPEDIDWDVSMGGTSAQYWDDRTMGGWSIFQFEHDERETKPLDEIARSSLASERRRLGPVERLDDRVVNGVEGWVLEHHGRNSFGRSEFVYEFGAVHGTYWTTFNFAFPKDNAATRDVIESVLASIEWKPIG